MAENKILIIEDDVAIRESLQELLETEGYRVTTAENGRAALDLLAGAEAPALILLDLMMPIMDGFEFREIQTRDEALARIPTLVMTARSLTPTERSSLSVSRILKKPIDIEQALSSIKNALAER